MRRRMGRPCLKRRMNTNLKSRYFKPKGIPVAELEVISLKKEELEALRLKNVEVLDQRECAKQMDTSPATLQRILTSAYGKISEALVKGKAIEIIE